MWALLCALGPKMMFEFILRYPAILLMPMFSPWTIGSISPGQMLEVSSYWTWLNILVTCIVTIVVSLSTYFGYTSLYSDFDMILALPPGCVSITPPKCDSRRPSLACWQSGKKWLLLWLSMMLPLPTKKCAKKTPRTWIQDQVSRPPALRFHSWIMHDLNPAEQEPLQEVLSPLSAN
jgi:hypothetical protein